MDPTLGGTRLGFRHYRSPVSHGQITVAPRTLASALLERANSLLICKEALFLTALKLRGRGRKGSCLNDSRCGQILLRDCLSNDDSRYPKTHGAASTVAGVHAEKWAQCKGGARIPHSQEGVSNVALI